MKLVKWFRKEVVETKELLKKVPSMLMTFFVLALVLMNLLANKSLDTGRFSFWLALDAGIIISWLMFLVMDLLTRAFGPKAANRLTVVAIGINLFVSGIFALASFIPGLWGESFIPEHGGIANQALNNTFGGTWYVLLGSTIAFLVAAVVNNFLNWGIGKTFKKNPNGYGAYMARSYGSTFVGQFVDNALFAFIVSVNFFGWTPLQAFMCALTGAVVELIFQAIFTPFGYRIAEKWRKSGIGHEVTP